MSEILSVGQKTIGLLTRTVTKETDPSEFDGKPLIIFNDVEFLKHLKIIQKVSKPSSVIWIHEGPVTPQIQLLTKRADFFIVKDQKTFDIVKPLIKSPILEVLQDTKNFWDKVLKGKHRCSNILDSRLTKEPTVHIVMPVYNSENWLEQAIQSIIEQSFEDWELIIVDDGSTDSSYSIALQMAENEPRIRVAKKENGGTGSALNLGWEYVTAKYQTWWASDSWVEPNWLSDLVDALDANPAVGFVYGEYARYVESTKQYDTGFQTREFDYQRHQTKCEVGCCWLWRKEVKDQVGDWSLELCEDYEMWLRMAEVTKFKKVPKLMGYWREHQTNLSHECNKNGWLPSRRIVSRHKWKKAKIKVAYLCPWLDAAGVGWFHAYGLTQSEHSIAVRHILKLPSKLMQYNDLLIGKDDPEIKQVLDECDIIHMNLTPEFDITPWLDQGKKLVYHLHGGPWVTRTDILDKFRSYGARFLSCEPRVELLVPEAKWVPNMIPLDLTETYLDHHHFNPLQDHLDLPFHVHFSHCYSAGKGAEEVADAMANIKKIHNIEMPHSAITVYERVIPIRSHLELKKKSPVTIDQITQGFIGMAGWIAMAQGSAVIAKLDQWSVREYTALGGGEMPPIINVAGVNELITELLDLWKNPERLRKIRIASREWMLKYYTQQRLNNYWAKIYQEA